MELVRYAESECQAWFIANEMVTPNPHHSLWLGLEGLSWKDSVHGNVTLKEARDCFTFESRSTSMCNGEHAKAFDMSALWNKLEDLIAKLKEP